MGPIVRGMLVYLFLLLVFRIAGKRTLSETTTFDLILLLIISETTGQAMMDGDHSLTGAFLVIITLITLDVILSHLKVRFSWMKACLDSSPLILVEHGQLLQHRMKKSRVEISDIMSVARETHGIGSLEQIDYAILEDSGTISIIPRAHAVDQKS